MCTGTGGYPATGTSMTILGTGWGTNYGYGYGYGTGTDIVQNGYPGTSTGTKVGTWVRAPEWVPEYGYRYEYLYVLCRFSGMNHVCSLKESSDTYLDGIGMKIGLL